jgi:hypothetical protein
MNYSCITPLICAPHGTPFSFLRSSTNRSTAPRKLMRAHGFVDSNPATNWTASSSSPVSRLQRRTLALAARFYLLESGKLIQREDSTTKVAIRRAIDASRTTAKLHSNNKRGRENPQEERDGDKELTRQCACLDARDLLRANRPRRNRRFAAAMGLHRRWGFGDLARRGLRRGKGREGRKGGSFLRGVCSASAPH